MKEAVRLTKDVQTVHGKLRGRPCSVTTRSRPPRFHPQHFTA